MVGSNVRHSVLDLDRLLYDNPFPATHGFKKAKNESRVFRVDISLRRRVGFSLRFRIRRLQTTNGDSLDSNRNGAQWRHIEPSESKSWREHDETDSGRRVHAYKRDWKEFEQVFEWYGGYADGIAEFDFV